MSYATNTTNQAPGQSSPGAGGKATGNDGMIPMDYTNQYGGPLGLSPGQSNPGAGGKGPISQIPIDQSGNVLDTNQPPNFGTPGTGGKMGDAMGNVIGTVADATGQLANQAITDQGVNLPQPGTDLPGLGGKVAGGIPDLNNQTQQDIARQTAMFGATPIGPTSGSVAGPQFGTARLARPIAQPGGAVMNPQTGAYTPLSQPARPVAQPAAPVRGRPTPQAIRQQAQAVAPRPVAPARQPIVAGRGSSRGRGR